MERIRIHGSRLMGLALGLLLAALPALAFAQTSGDDGSAAGSFLVILFSCLCVVVFIGIHLAITYWIYNDAKKRGNPNAVIWAVLNFLSDPLGLLLYLVIGRNQGMTPPPAGPTGPSTTARY